MLIEFNVGNFRSFKKKCTFSLEAQGITEDPKQNIARIGKYKIVKTAAIYGANSSGKSNFIRAMGEMSNCVRHSIRLNDNDVIREYDPFLLSKGKDNEPTHFEVLFIIDNTRYRYGFEFNSSSISKEWLLIKEEANKEKPLFIRNKEGIGVSKLNFIEGIGIEEKTNDNRLFLSLCAQLGGTISKKVVNWFQCGINVISGIQNIFYKEFTCRMIHKNDVSTKTAMLFFKNLKLGFDKIDSSEEEIDIPNHYPVELKNYLKQKNDKKSIVLHTVHNKYNKKGQIDGEQYFDVTKHESEGTQKLIDIAGPLFDTLERGSILFIDELDAKMHPLISEHIIKLFNNKSTNPKNAQLIFSTHDTHLLSSRLLRRDQIWFTEKDNVEQTDLYSMMDITFTDGSKPRKDSNYEKNYINGRYGAIPFIINE